MPLHWRSLDARSGQSLDWDHGDTVGEFQIETRVGRAPDQETQVARHPDDPVHLGKAQETEQETRVAPPPAELLSAAQGDEKETRVQKPPRRRRAQGSSPPDGSTLSLRGNRWSRARPTTGVGARPRAVIERAAREEPTRNESAPRTPARTRCTRQTSPSLTAESLELPVAMLVLERMKLQPMSARITDISRSAAFLACSFLPLAGRRLVLRVASDVGVGIAVGYVQATFEGAGFAVRINASTEEFRAYVDALRSFSDNVISSAPRLTEPITMQIL